MEVQFNSNSSVMGTENVAERIEVRVREKDVEALLQSALEVGAQVISVTPHRVSLESIFLHAVEEGSR